MAASDTLERSPAPTQDAPEEPWPSAAARTSRVWPAAALSMLLVAALLTVLFVRNHRYFYIDDRISETVPKWRDIGRTLLAGDLPWLSTDIVNGGAYAGEYLNAVYNPMNLALCVVVATLDDVALGAFLYVVAHCLLATAAAAWLGRTLGLTTWWSVALAVSVGFNQYTIVWTATAWNQGLSSYAWLLVAVAGAVAFHLQPRRRYGWTVLAGTYGVLTSGWPHAVVLLGFFLAALIVARLVRRTDLAGTAWLTTWAAGGLLCSLVAVYPLVAQIGISSRTSSVTNDVNFLVASLENLLQFWNPGYYGFFANFDGYRLQRLPHFYTAWFVLPALVFLRPARLPRQQQTLLWAVLATLLVAALSTLGPERLLTLRFPTRSLQYFHLFLVLAVGLLVAHGRFVFSRRRFGLMLGLIGLGVVNALQVDPAGLLRVALANGVVVGLVVLLWWQLGERGPLPAPLRGGSAAGATVALGSVFVLLALAVAHPSGRGVDWGFPHDVTSVSRLSAKDYTLYYGNYLPPGAGLAGFREFHPATMGLTVGDRQVNGYSSLGHALFRRWFPIDDQGNFQPGAAAQFTQTDPVSGLQMLELLRVDQIITLLGDMEADLQPVLGPGWSRTGAGQFTATYRHAEYTLPGLVSWTSPGVTAGPAAGCESTDMRECVTVRNAPGQTGEVVFARLWLPGYTATLDGRDVEVTRHSDMLVSVPVPAGATGELVLSYRPPGTVPLTALAVLVLVGLALASTVLPGRASPAPRSAPARPTPQAVQAP